MPNPTVLLPGTRTIVLPREPRRGLFGHFLAVLLQPVAFFQQMPTTRQWIGAALIILILAGAAEVRRTSLSDTTGGGDMLGGMPFDPTGGVPNVPDAISGGGLQLEPPIPTGVIPGDATADSSITQTTVTALLASSSVVLAWILQTIILSPVPMFNASPPSIARNIQIAVWASVPLGLLALIQLVYYGLGGEVGTIGVSILLERWEAYSSLPVLVQALLHSLSLHLTLFWLWSLILLFIGARRALGGRWWAVVVIWVIWVAFVLLLPVLTGAITPLDPTSTPTNTGLSAAPIDGIVPMDGVPPGVERDSGAAPGIRIVPGVNSP